MTDGLSAEICQQQIQDLVLKKQCFVSLARETLTVWTTPRKAASNQHVCLLQERRKHLKQKQNSVAKVLARVPYIQLSSQVGHQHAPQSSHNAHQTWHTRPKKPRMKRKHNKATKSECVSSKTIEMHIVNLPCEGHRNASAFCLFTNALLHQQQVATTHHRSRNKQNKTATCEPNSALPASERSTRQATFRFLARQNKTTHPYTLTEV